MEEILFGEIGHLVSMLLSIRSISKGMLHEMYVVDGWHHLESNANPSVASFPPDI